MERNLARKKRENKPSILNPLKGDERITLNGNYSSVRK